MQRGGGPVDDRLTQEAHCSAKRPPWLTLDVGGVGYELEAPMSTFYRLPEPGKPLSLVTHLVVREDAHVLFGFSTEAERALFRNLLKVSQRRRRAWRSACSRA